MDMDITMATATARYQHQFHHQFQLDDKTIDMPLSELDIINVTYYKSKTDYLDIYDTLFTYNCDIPSLCTSILEYPPKVINGKRIITLDGESFFTKHNNQSLDTHYPSFHFDIESTKKNIFTYRKLLQKSLDYTTTPNTPNTPNTPSCLVRFYKLEHSIHNYTERNQLSEYEVVILLWEWEFMRFMIIVNPESGCMTLHVNISITEKNSLISSKRDFINDKLKTISKIIYHISNNN